MARAGILYSQVAQAAAKLVADDKNPTVDSVREALGGTGSKSTIAPLLKRWKAEHHDAVAGSEVGLPPELLQAVKGVYDKLQADVQQQLERAREEHLSALQGATDQVAQGEAANRLLTTTNATLSKELDQTKEALAQLQTAHHAQTVAFATLQAENAGLLQRLVDRQGEIEGLHRQLDQARTQFEHYQDATAVQRAEERQQAEQSRLRLESELTEARQNAAVQKAAVAQRELDMTRLQQDKDRTATELSTLQAAYTTLQAEHRHQAQQIQASGALHAELRAQVERTSGALAQTRSELAILSAEKPQFQSRIAALEAEVQSLLDENKGLTIDKARLEGMHSRPAAQPSTA
jgi:chromosome segregation ATPase